MVTTLDLIQERDARRAERSKRLPGPARDKTRVGAELQRILVTRFGVQCFTCFHNTLTEMNKRPIADIRADADDYAKRIWENAKEGKARGREPVKLIAWAGEKPLEQYASLVLEACDICDPPPIEIPEGAVVVNANAHGFGDAMVTAWISEGSKGSDKPLIHHATGAKADLLRLFGQLVSEAPVEGMKTTHVPGGRENAGLNVNRVELRRQWLGCGGIPARPTLAIPPEDTAWAESLLTDKTVVMFPQTAHPIRVWPVSYWLELYQNLIDAGYDPLVCVEHDDIHFRSCNSIRRQSWGRVLAAVKGSRLVITNSSGPAHVCGTMGHPTLVLCGPTDPDIAFSHMDSLNCLFEESMGCIKCHYKAPTARPSCWVGCEALFRLSPEKALSEALGMLERDPVREVAPGMWRQISTERVEYDDQYFAKYVGYRDTDLGRQITASRVELVCKYGCETALDVGIGCGAFVEAFGVAKGFDVMPAAVAWLEERGRYRSPYAMTGDYPDAITCWDSLEHLEDPGRLLDCVKPGMHLFVSLPVFTSLEDVLASKHYRPGEHLSYWTDAGLRAFCASRGLVFVEFNQRESELGRDSIGTYVFKRPELTPTGDTAYIVAGPTSAGNRLLASIMVRSGCSGSGSTDQPKCIEDLPQAVGVPFVTIQHTDLHSWIPALRARGFERVVVVVIIREQVANVASMFARGHCDRAGIETAGDARRIINRQVAVAASDAIANKAELEFVTYEGMTEQALSEWLPSIGIPYKSGPIDLVGQDAPSRIVNVNPCHYRGGS